MGSPILALLVVMACSRRSRICAPAGMETLFSGLLGRSRGLRSSRAGLGLSSPLFWSLFWSGSCAQDVAAIPKPKPKITDHLPQRCIDPPEFPEPLSWVGCSLLEIGRASCRERV